MYLGSLDTFGTLTPVGSLVKHGALDVPGSLYLNGALRKPGYGSIMCTCPRCAIGYGSGGAVPKCSRYALSW